MKIRGKWKPFSKLPFDFHEKNNGMDLDKSKIDDRLRGSDLPQDAAATTSEKAGPIRRESPSEGSEPPSGNPCRSPNTCPYSGNTNTPLVAGQVTIALSPHFTGAVDRTIMT